MALLVTAVGLAAQDSPKRIFADLAKVKGVTSTYISGDMMKYTIAGGISKRAGLSKFFVNGSNLNIQEIKAEGLDLFTADTAEGVKNLRNGIKEIMKKNGKELTVLMEVNEDGNHVRIMSPEAVKDGVIHDLIIETSEEDNQLTIVYLYGEITL